MGGRGVVGRSTGFGFFFSSRRRHTRLQGDWSSDVCSSDLSCEMLQTRPVGAVASEDQMKVRVGIAQDVEGPDRLVIALVHLQGANAEDDTEIGRASCRERG